MKVNNNNKNNTNSKQIQKKPQNNNKVNIILEKLISENIAPLQEINNHTDKLTTNQQQHRNKINNNR